jgi:hypothetical protein
VWQVSTVPLLRRQGVEPERIIGRVCQERCDRADRAVAPIGMPDVNPICGPGRLRDSRPSNRRGGEAEATDGV